MPLQVPNDACAGRGGHQHPPPVLNTPVGAGLGGLGGGPSERARRAEEEDEEEEEEEEGERDKAGQGPTFPICMLPKIDPVDRYDVGHDSLGR